MFWGDEHTHTGWSADAGMSGATLTPEDALRLARGEEVVSNTGQPVQLSRPLDWLAVTDHSDGMGVISELKDGNPELMADPTMKKWHDMMAAGPEQAAAATMELINAQSNKRLPPAVMDPKFAKSVWQKNNAIMEKYNEPGRFTAFIAYEWTSNAGLAGDRRRLHRRVWATENTREAIWDAMKRKEAYSTSGSRIVVRFFGGFDFTPADAQGRTPAEAG